MQSKGSSYFVSSKIETKKVTDIVNLFNNFVIKDQGIIGNFLKII